MWGAIIGDIVGSIYEFNDAFKSKEFDFFDPGCDFTDDSVCTAAVANILLDDLPPAETLQQWCRQFPGRGYGGMFAGWIKEADPQPYNSFGNGSAMRVSPAAYLNRRRTLPEALAAADRVTEVSHNHPEGIKGARATVTTIWLAFQGESTGAIHSMIEEQYGYDLSRSLDEIRPDYEFNEICQITVPEAIICALDSDSYEDAIRNAISLGGDSDTLAAIAGAIAEARHGIPKEFITKTKTRYLSDAPNIIKVLDRMYATAIN